LARETGALRNPLHARTEFTPCDTWEEVDAVAQELGPLGPLAIFCVGTGVRPEEAFGGEWRDVDLVAGVFTMQRTFAKGRQKNYGKTDRCPAARLAARRGRRVARGAARARGDLVPGDHRRIYDMRHTLATWSLAAGIGVFTVARRMRTSVKLIDATHGHLAHDAEDADRGLLDACDAANNGRGHDVGSSSEASQTADDAAA
jgi:integrase